MERRKKREELFGGNVKHSCFFPVFLQGWIACRVETVGLKGQTGGGEREGKREQKRKREREREEKGVTEYRREREGTKKECEKRKEEEEERGRER